MTANRIPWLLSATSVPGAFCRSDENRIIFTKECQVNRPEQHPKNILKFKNISSDNPSRPAGTKRGAAGRRHTIPYKDTVVFNSHFSNRTLLFCIVPCPQSAGFAFRWFGNDKHQTVTARISMKLRRVRVGNVGGKHQRHKEVKERTKFTPNSQAAQDERPLYPAAAVPHTDSAIPSRRRLQYLIQTPQHCFNGFSSKEE